LHAVVDEVPLPEAGGAASPDARRTFEEANGDSRLLQGLGATEAGDSGPDDRNRSEFFHDRSLNGKAWVAIIENARCNAILPYPKTISKVPE